MAYITGTEFAKAHGGVDDTVTIASIAAELHEHKTGSYVYLKANRTGVTTYLQRPYRVLGQHYISFTEGGVEKLQSHANDSATEATSAGTPGDDPLSPNFYQIQETDLAGNLKAVAPLIVHEYDMEILSEHIDAIELDVNDWVNPS